MSKKTRAVRQGLFLDAIGRGASVVEAAAYAGVARATVYAWAEKDPGFEERWELAEAMAAGALRVRAYELAMGGNVRLLLFLLEAADRKQGVVGRGEDVVGEIQVVGLKEGETYAGDFIEFVGG